MIRLHTHGTVDWAVRLVRPLENWLNDNLPLVPRSRFENLLGNYLETQQSLWVTSRELDQAYETMDHLESEIEKMISVRVQPGPVLYDFSLVHEQRSYRVDIDLGRVGALIDPASLKADLPNAITLTKEVLFDRASKVMRKSLDSAFSRIVATLQVGDHQTSGRVMPEHAAGDRVEQIL